ncbi:DUF2249 domain-containing protein [Paenibacillus brevis]|uniref:DUF2249 domain-containing protein n=1 Tax=Paenibacillus brevis TaxID=2841508 RepID=A0ABS6FTQ5_9BACL|nr:DUF2249 domain-containing protein [Paenibacillus brevis]MBU5673614.1 DUF2249 domain-containing protein [Paenibacillus brevis]
MENFKATVVAPEYPPQIKHKVIFETFDTLNPGEDMLLINDHDPKPLFFQFQIERPNKFTWEYLEQGPETFRVKIGRV